MRTTVALRSLAAALLAGGTLVGVTAGTTAPAAAGPSYTGVPGGSADRGRPVPGTVTSATALAVREAPTSHAAAVDRLAPGSRDRILCAVRGQSVGGNPYWYWLVGAQGWASAAYVDSHGRWVPNCADPCPVWKDGHWTNWDAPSDDDWWRDWSGPAG